MKYLVLIATLLVAGCVPTIVMKNPKTGEVAQCHGDSWDWVPAASAEQCAAGYEKAGWVRM